MNNFEYQGGFNHAQKQSAFKIWHAKNHDEVIISLTNEFSTVVQNAILSNYCENKALVAFAKQLVSASESRNKIPKMDKRPYRRTLPSYGRNNHDHDNFTRRGHHADVEDYMDDMDGME